MTSVANFPTQRTRKTMISFHIPIVPPKATSQTKRLVIANGKPRFFSKKAHQRAENDLLLMCAAHRPQSPLFGPLRLEVHFVFPWRKTEIKANRKNGWMPCHTRPDCDNLVKLVADVLTRLHFYGDDGQIADLRVTKAWGDVVGISVRIEEIHNEPNK